MSLHSFVNRLRQTTFKNRIMASLVISSFVPLLCISIISYYTIHSILSNKVESVIQGTLEQDVQGMENTMNNLVHVSQQLALSGNINGMLEELQTETNQYRKLKLFNDIKAELNIIQFSNPNVGLIMYTSPDSNLQEFENFIVHRSPFFEELSTLVKKNEITYYGPHQSYNANSKRLVFSIMRKVDLPELNLYLYIETAPNALKPLNEFDSSVNGGRKQLILDNEGQIVFSGDRRQFPEHQLFPDADAATNSGATNQYVWFKQQSNPGWSLLLLIPKKELNQERNQWLVQISGISLILLLLSVCLAWLLWRMAYGPLKKFKSEIVALVHTDDKEPTDQTHIQEFDVLLYSIRNMKKKIWDLYKEIEHKEQRRTDLEVEKLLYQINPHFLMNTLDTIHWMAMMSGHKEIDRLVLSLNKLLSYNLGKMGEETTISNEIQALKEYMQLQQIRYNFEFDVDIDVDRNAMDLPIPRFILQPLVENALYHGVSDEGYIHVNIRLADDLRITVQDNGAGMTEDKIRGLLQDDLSESRQVGMGIGMKYVKRILEVNYTGKAGFDIKSEVGKGTLVSLRIPVMDREGHAT